MSELQDSQNQTASMSAGPEAMMREMQLQQERDRNESKLAEIEKYYKREMEDMGIPYGYREFTVKTWNPDLQPEIPAGEWRKLWNVAMTGKNLILYSLPFNEENVGVGIGKSHFTTALLWERRKRNLWNNPERFLWLSARSWSMKFSNGGIQQGEMADRIASARIVLIDDIGQEGDGKRRLAIADTLAIAHENETQILGSANITREEMGRYYGSAIISRIEGNGDIVGIKGIDLRRTPCV
jgi:DNA replication protein DnaC